MKPSLLCELPSFEVRARSPKHKKTLVIAVRGCKNEEQANAQAREFILAKYGVHCQIFKTSRNG